MFQYVLQENGSSLIFCLFSSFKKHKSSVARIQSPGVFFIFTFLWLTWVITHGNELKNISVSEPILHLTSHLWENRSNGKSIRTAMGKAKSYGVGKSSVTSHPRINHDLNVILIPPHIIAKGRRKGLSLTSEKKGVASRQKNMVEGAGKFSIIVHFSWDLWWEFLHVNRPLFRNNPVINIVAVSGFFLISLLFLVNCF